MTSPQPSPPPGRLAGRTRLVTIVSIAVVGIAGATAVSANIGILDQSSDQDVGELSAAADLATPSTQVVDVYLPADPATTLAPAAAPAGDAAIGDSTTVPAAPAAGNGVVQQFAVDVAGTVAVARTDAGVRLDGVVPAAGWSWTLTQHDAATLLVTMTNGARTFELTATAAPDGTIAASVTEPIATPAAAPAVAVPGGDDHGDDDEHESGEHESGEHESGEHEGGGDDD